MRSWPNILLIFRNKLKKYRSTNVNFSFDKKVLCNVFLVGKVQEFAIYM